MTGKPDKERMGQDMKYVIDSKVYENHINDEVHLYGLLHQLAFLAEKAKDEKDLENLVTPFQGGHQPQDAQGALS